MGASSSHEARQGVLLQGARMLKPVEEYVDMEEKKLVKLMTKVGGTDVLLSWMIDHTGQEYGALRRTGDGSMLSDDAVAGIARDALMEGSFRAYHVARLKAVFTTLLRRGIVALRLFLDYIHQAPIDTGSWPVLAVMTVVNAMIQPKGSMTVNLRRRLEFNESMMHAATHHPWWNWTPIPRGSRHYGDDKRARLDTLPIVASIAEHNFDLILVLLTDLKVVTPTYDHINGTFVSYIIVRLLDSLLIVLPGRDATRTTATSRILDMLLADFIQYTEDGACIVSNKYIFDRDLFGSPTKDLRRNVLLMATSHQAMPYALRILDQRDPLHGTPGRGDILLLKPTYEGGTQYSTRPLLVAVAANLYDTRAGHVAIEFVMRRMLASPTYPNALDLFLQVYKFTSSEMNRDNSDVPEVGPERTNNHRDRDSTWELEDADIGMEQIENDDIILVELLVKHQVEDGGNAMAAGRNRAPSFMPDLPANSYRRLAHHALNSPRLDDQAAAALFMLFITADYRGTQNVVFEELVWEVTPDITLLIPRARKSDIGAKIMEYLSNNYPDGQYEHDLRPWYSTSAKRAAM